MFAPHRAALLLCAAAVVGCSSDSGSDVLAPAPLPRLAASAADVPVYNFSASFGVRINAINTAAPEHEASFTQDGHTMYFRCDELPPPLGRGNQICVSRLIGNFEDGRWTDPELLPYPINTEFGDHEPKISRNGKRLFFQSDRLEPGDLDGRRDFDVYYSDLVGGEWQDPVRLPAPINTEFADHCVYFEDMRAYDDLELETDVYLASNRRDLLDPLDPSKNTMGGNDMWVSHRKDGVYSEPVNLGPNINSPANDHMAMVGPDGKLWVTTTDPTRPGAMGGEDLYRSTRQADGSWGPIVNMGPSFNTAKDDRCADFAMGTGKGGMERDDEANTNAKGNVIYAVYASTDRPGGMGNRDLWYFRLDDLLRSEQE
jgi:hypothetical protein